MGRVGVASASSGRGAGWPCGGGLDLGVELNVLLLSVVATNMVSLYHLSLCAATVPPLLPHHHQQRDGDEDLILIRQLNAIRSGVSQLNQLRSSSPPPPPPPAELLLYSRLAPVASACPVVVKAAATDGKGGPAFPVGDLGVLTAPAEDAASAGSEDAPALMVKADEATAPAKKGGSEDATKATK